MSRDSGEWRRLTIGKALAENVVALDVISLKLAAPAELPLLASYMLGLRTEDPMPANTLADNDSVLSAMNELMSNPTIGRLWLIHKGTSPVGYAALTFVHSLEFGGRCAFVDELYVEPVARNRGVGQTAMKLVAVEAKKLKVRLLLLEVSPENERAARLYEQVGFTPRKYRLMTRML